MIQLDEKKLARLRTTNQQLNEKYGEHGTDTREKFNEKSMAWYYGDILRERRKELKLTQKQLAQKIGKEQSYIARVEKGEVDIQPSSAAGEQADCKCFAEITADVLYLFHVL